MTIGLVGRKVGMTQVFESDGNAVPVTVIEVAPNRVTQIKNIETDGYRAVQITTGTRRATRVSKALAQHFAKAKTPAGHGCWEFRLADDEGQDLEVGKELTVELFAEGQHVDVIGTSKGKGFQGGIKRHNFAAQRNSHGNSVSHRALGSTGQNQTPGKVFKGKKMPGHLGDVTCTVQSQRVVKVDVARNLLLVRGAIPGAKGGNVIVKPAVKKATGGKK